MALPTSGTISMSAIRSELGIPSQAPFSLNTARAGGYVPLNPYSPTLPPSSGSVSLASWYGYCHSCTSLYTFTIYKAANHYPQGWSSASAACSGSRDVAWTVVSSSSTLGVGSSLYTLQSGVYIPWNLITDPGYLWAFDGTGNKPIRMTANESNVIAEVGTCISCKEYYNPQSYTVVCYPNDCNGNAMGTVYVDPNQSICAQEGTAGFELIDIGNC